MRPKGSAELLSDRRRRALKLLGAKLSLHEVVRRIGCATSSVMRWGSAWRRLGADSHQVRFSPGRPRDVDELMEDTIRSINGIRSSPAKLRGCIQQSELSLFLR
jgi:transposase